MAKPDLGMKRSCLECEARFYDLNKNPIICPKCGTPFDVETSISRVKPQPAPAPKAKPETEADEDETDAEGETWYRLDGIDAAAPFFMALAGDSDLWAFVSSAGSPATKLRTVSTKWLTKSSATASCT